MQFIILKENLQKALSIVSRNIPTRPQLPILSNVLLEVKDNQLKISTTNLELGIIYRTGVKAAKEGIVATPGKLLTELVSNITADKIELEQKEGKLLIKAGKTKASLATTDHSDFPPFPEKKGVEKKLPIEKIKSTILHVVFAASNDETRPVLTGVKTLFEKNKTTLSATDGYRLSKEEIKGFGMDEEMEVILPAQSLNELVRIAAELDEKEVGFQVVEKKNQVIFTLPGINLFSRIIDGEYPDIEKIIPKEFKTKVVVDKDKLAQAVKTTAIFARGAANIVKIKITKEGLQLSANTPQIGENTDFVEAKVEGEEMETAFNYRFLLDLFSNIDEKDLLFESSGPLNPGVFRPQSKSSFLHLVMPVRVQE